MKIPSSNLGRTCYVQKKKLFPTFRTFFVHKMFSPCSAKRRASDKDLPVKKPINLNPVPLQYHVKKCFWPRAPTKKLRKLLPRSKELNL
jgi:hypothetical protein